MNLIVPTLGFDQSIIDRLFNSIEHPIEIKAVVNDEQENRGVAATWNQADLPSIIINDDAWFMPGSIERLIRESSDRIVTLSSIGWSCFVWTLEAHDLLGTFDENFWPAYWEDTDMRMRLINAGISPHVCNAPMGHEKPKGHMEKYYKALSACWDLNKQYFEAKWGPYSESAEKGKPYKTPFNRGGSIKDWTLDTDRRKKLETLWRDNLEHP